LFTTDPGFWKTVHASGDDYDSYVASLKAAERKQWQARLVSKDPVIHTLLAAPTGDRAAAQADRLKGLLKGKAKKKGFALAHIEPPPLSMELATPWMNPAGGGGSTGGSTAAAAAKAVATGSSKGFVGGRDFDTLARGRPRSCVYKPGWSDAWRAGLRDEER